MITNFYRLGMGLIFTFISITLINSYSFAEKGMNITYFENVEILNTSQFLRSDELSQERITFSAYGKVFDVAMEINDDLIKSLPLELKTKILEESPPYKGYLEGVADSWVRLTRVGDIYHGVIWDGEEIYILESSSAVNIQNATILKTDEGEEEDDEENDDQIIYLLADAEPGDGVCALDGNAETSISDFSKLTEHLSIQATALPAATMQLNVAVVGDVEFRNFHQPSPESVVVNHMNTVDGIFSDAVKGVSVHINISDIQILNNNSGMVSTNHSNLLGQFVNFTNAPGFNNPGLAHLYTGKEINNNIIGVAYLGVLCRQDIGVGLSQVNATNSGIAAALTIAHELGHNFGAPHDNQSGSACSGVSPGLLMNPFINGSDTFSQCSKNQMANDIANAVCIVPVADLTDMNVNLPDNNINAQLGDPVNFRVEVSNVGVNTGENVNLTINLSNGLTSPGVSTDTGSCQVTNPTLIECNLGNIDNSGIATVTVDATASTGGNLITTATVTSDNDQNPNNDVLDQVVSVTVPIDDQIQFLVTPLFNPYYVGGNGGNIEYTVELLNLTNERQRVEVFRKINDGAEKRISRRTLSSGRTTVIRGRERISNRGRTALPDGNYTMEIILRTENGEISQSFNFSKGIVGGEQINFVMDPIDEGIVLGSRGGNVTYNLLIVNNTSSNQLVEVYRTIIGPNKNDERRVSRRTMRPGTSLILKRRDRLSRRDADGNYSIDVRLVAPFGEQTQSINFSKVSN